MAEDTVELITAFTGLQRSLRTCGSPVVYQGTGVNQQKWSLGYWGTQPGGEQTSYQESSRSPEVQLLGRSWLGTRKPGFGPQQDTHTQLS